LQVRWVCKFEISGAGGVVTGAFVPRGLILGALILWGIDSHMSIDSTGDGSLGALVKWRLIPGVLILWAFLLGVLIPGAYIEQML